MIKTYRPTSPGIRQRKTLVKGVEAVKPLKKLTKGKKGPSGRSKGRITVRHRQRGAKKLHRLVDFKRDKKNIDAKVASIEDDPNRGANIALLHYVDGEKRYILAPKGLEKGMVVVSGENVELIVGNAMPLKNIPVGVAIHNVEINPGAGGVLAKGAGNSAQILAKEGNYVNIKLPSGEVKKVLGICYATIGSLSNEDLRNIVLGKAGVKRRLGFRPTTRGVAMSSPKKGHPHGGSYSTSGIGMHPKTPWGKKARGVKTRKRSRTDHTIVKDRRKR